MVRNHVIPRRVPATITLAVLGLAGLLGGLTATSPALAISACFTAAIVLVAMLRPNLYLGLLLLIPALPLSAITSGERSVLSQLGGTTVAGIILVVSVPLMMVVLAARRHLLTGLRVFAIPVSWVAWSTLTLAYTDWADEGVRLAFKLWYPILLGMLAYFASRETANWPAQTLKRWWYAGYAFASFIALMRLGSIGLSTWGAGETYRYSSLGSPSPFSFFILLTFVLAYSLWTRERRRVDGLVAVTAVLQVLLTLVRISTAALLLAMVLISLLLGITVRRRLRGLLVALTVGAALLGALLTFPVFQEGVFFKEVSSLEDIVSNWDNLNTQGRDVIWGRMMSEYRSGDLLIGRGLGSSTRLFKEGVVPAGVVHSEYIRVLYEQGILGLAWFVGILGASAAFLGFAGRRARGLERVALMAACVAVIVYAVLCVTDNSLDYYSLLGQYVTVLAGVGLGLRSRRISATRC